MKKKIFVIILITLMIVSIMPTVAFATVHPLSMYDMYRTFDLDANSVKTGDTITINAEAKKVVIKGNPSKTYTNVSIVCENAGGVDFIIQDLNLNTSTAGYECIKIKGPNNQIELRGSSHLTGGYNMPAIMVETGASLTITGYGFLTARGGEYGAGIGGRIQTGCGTVNIQGGNVTAIGGKGASGIGGGGGRIGFPEWGIYPVHGGNGGTVEISNNAVVYARGDWDDIGRGAFIANDGNVDSTDTYTVTLTANTIPNRKASMPEADRATVTVCTPYVLDLSSVFEDEDGDSLTYEVSVDGAPGISANTNYTYTPASARNTLLAFIANDGNVNSTDTYTVTLTANTIPTRRASMPEADKVTVTVGTPYVLDLSSVFEDADGDSLTYEVSVDGAQTTNAETYYTYTPASAGSTLLAFIASDGSVDSTDTYTVTLIVKPTPTPKPTPPPTPTTTTKPTKTPSPTQTQSPVYTPVPTQDPTTSPAAQKTEAPTKTPQSSAAPIATIKPSVIEENEEQGTITIELNTEDLPKGTEKIVLLDGKTIDVTKTETILLEIIVEELDANGILTIVPIDEEGTPLGNYSIEVTDGSMEIDAGKGWSAISSALLWILIAATVLAVAIFVIYILIKKEKVEH